MADNGKAVVVFLFSFFMIFTVKDLFVAESRVEATSKEIPLTNLGSAKFMGPTMKILYCSSCGYRNAFEQYSDLITKKYPEVVVEGGNYPPTGLNAWLARMLTVGKMLLILGIMTAPDLGRFLRGPALTWWSWCVGNKIYAGIMIFLICNMLEGQLMSTGAFEITFNDVPVWSKIETGRIPQPPELFQIIDNQLRFQAQDPPLNLKTGINF